MSRGIEGLVPASGKHAITKVIATIFIPQAFLKPENIFERVKDLDDFKVYQKKSKLRPTTISINNNMPRVQKNSVTGIVFEQYGEDGKLLNSLTINNIKENSQAIIAFENRSYPDWELFFKRFVKDINCLASSFDIYTNAISLAYVDEFIWNKAEMINIDDIFNKKSELLNKKFRESKNASLVMSSQGEINDSSNNYEEKTEIAFNNDLKRIVIHHHYAIMLNDIELYENSENKELFRSYYDIAHDNNKMVLKDILSKESCELINLT
jgi:uncharacterized protein (TIGR04255 family)